MKATLPTGLSARRTAAYIVIIFFALGFVYLTVARDMRFFRVPSKSMAPAIAPDDFVVALNAEEYRRGDIVVLDDPAAAGSYLCKRIVAIGGDVISVSGGGLYIDGSYVSEPYIAEPMAYTLPPFRVPDDEVFVLGDNRNWSVDSHNWSEDPRAARAPGGVPSSSVVGRVRFIYLPVGRAGPVESYPLKSVEQLKPSPAGNFAGKTVQ